MKKLFWIDWQASWPELANVVFIMPMPGSQQMNSIDLAYFLYQWRWPSGWDSALLLLGWWKGATWHLGQSAGCWFQCWSSEPWPGWPISNGGRCHVPSTTQLVRPPLRKNKIDSNRLVIGVTLAGIQAYPIQLIGYHHYIQDPLR